MANLYDFSGVERNFDRFLDLYNMKQQRGLQERRLGLAERSEGIDNAYKQKDSAYKQMLIDKEYSEIRRRQELERDPTVAITVMAKAIREARQTGGDKFAEMTYNSFKQNPKYSPHTKGYEYSDFKFDTSGNIYSKSKDEEGNILPDQYDRVGVDGKVEHLDLSDKKPPSAKEYEYSKILPAEERPEYEKFATKPKMSIDLGSNKKFLDKLMESTAQDFTKQQEAARLSVQTIQNIDEARSKLDAGIYAGAGANIKLGFDKWLRSTGLNIGGEKAANTEAFAGATGRLVGKIIKDFGSGTGLSDADRQYAERIAGGDITLTEQSIRKLFDIAEKAQRVQIKAYNNLATQIENKYGKEELPFDMKIQEPEETIKLPANVKTYPQAIEHLISRGMTKEQAIQWIKDND